MKQKSLSDTSTPATCTVVAGSFAAEAAALASTSDMAVLTLNSSASFATEVPTKSAPVLTSCEGIFPDYRKTVFQTNIKAYAVYATYPLDAKYTIGIGALICTNMFSKTCTGKGMFYITKLGKIHACKECHDKFYVSISYVIYDWISAHIYQ